MKRQGRPKPPGDGGTSRPDAAKVVVEAEAYATGSASDDDVEIETEEPAEQAAEPPPDPEIRLAEIVAQQGRVLPEYIHFEKSRCPEAHARLEEIMRIRSTAKGHRALVGSIKRSWQRWPRLILAGAVGAAAGIVLGDPVTGFTAATAVALAESALDARKIRHKRGEKPYPDVPEFQNAWAFMSYVLVRQINGYNHRLAAINTIRADMASERLVRMADIMAIELLNVGPRLRHARDILLKFQPPPKTDIFHEVEGHHDRLWAYDPLGQNNSDACLGWLETVQDELFVGKFEEQLGLDLYYIHVGQVEVGDMDPWEKLKRTRPDLWAEIIEGKPPSPAAEEPPSDKPEDEE